MVKDSKKLELSPTGFPRKPYVKRKPGLTRDGRLMLRVHEDVEELIKLRAAENNMTVSRYIEGLMIGWLSADPRNPKLASNGARVPRVLPPEMQKAADPARFGARWHEFTQVYRSIFGHEPPRQWLDDFTAGAPADGDFDPTGEDPEPMPLPSHIRPKRR